MKICDDLRQAVLQAAIQGKLTTQRLEDGDARELLKQIAAEKAQLIKEKNIKKEKPLPEITEDEIPFEVPENWVWCRLRDIILYDLGGGTPSKQEVTYWVNGDIPWMTVKDYPKSSIFVSATLEHITEKGLKNSSTNLIVNNNIIVCTRVGLGKICINEVPVAINQDLRALFFPCFINKKYFIHFYKTVLVEGKGTTVKGIKRDELLNMLVPLPPLAEQHRIVAKVENVMAEIDELEKVENELNVLKTAFPGAMKAALLQAAMQGKLTTQRKEDGDARELLEQIAKEKAQLIKENKIKKEKPLSKITEGEIPFDVPENWIWCRLGDLISVYGGLAYNKTNLSVSHNEMITVLRGGNILDLSYAFFDNDVKISPEFVKKEDLYLKKNQLITPAVTSLENLGKMARIERDYNNVVAGGFVLNIIPVLNEDIFSKYLLYMLSMPVMRARYAEIATKSGQAFYNLSRYKLLDSIIPLPPLAEQQRIVVKLEKLLPLCDGLAEE